MVAMPRSIRVGPYDITIVSAKGAEGDHFGEYSSDTQTIFIYDAARHSGVIEAETLIHELMHAVYRNGYLRAGDDEERVVSVFATAWTQVVRDNQPLVAWLKSVLR